MDIELRQLRRQAQTGGPKEHIVYLVSLLRSLPPPLFKEVNVLLRGVEDRTLSWEEVESILNIHHNTPENRDIISNFCSQFLSSFPTCQCENSICTFCQGGNCVQLAKIDTWIRDLGHFCYGCVTQMPIQYHSDFSSRQYYLETGIIQSNICRCSICQPIYDKVEYILHLKAPHLPITYIDLHSMVYPQSEYQELQIGTRVPAKWRGRLLPTQPMPQLSDYLMILNSQQPTAWSGETAAGIIYLSSIAASKISAKSPSVPAIIILNRHNTGNELIWKGVA